MAAHRLVEGTVIGDAYRIVRPLSAGGMGEVYVAEQLSTGKLRALKLMHNRLQADAKLRERFVKEARVASSLESAHVVEVIGAGVEDESGTPWLAMELLDGADLAEHLEQHGAMSTVGALDLLEQVCHAVGEAHDAGVVHRDLKPENIFIAKARAAGRKTTVKVLDFGIAKLMADAQTMGTQAIGSPAWMAPEQAEAGGAITPAADVWALGLIAFWMLTGASYWRAAEHESPSMHAFLKEVLFEVLPRASKRAADLGRAERLPAGFDDWFDRCVHREPRARFRDARELFEAFALLVGDTRSSSEGSSRLSGSSPEGSSPTLTLASASSPATAAHLEPMSTEAFLESSGVGTSAMRDEDEEGTAATQEVSAAGGDPPVLLEQTASKAAATLAAEQSAAPTMPVAAEAPTRARAVREHAGPRSKLLIALAAATVLAVGAWLFFSVGSVESTLPASEISSVEPPTVAPIAEGSADTATVEASAVPNGSGDASDRTSKAGTGKQTSSASSAEAEASATSSADATEHPPFNRFLAENQVRFRAKTAETMCRGKDPDIKAVTVTLVFGPDGKVVRVQMDRQLGFTATGFCVKNFLQTMFISPYAGGEEAITLTLSLG